MHKTGLKFGLLFILLIGAGCSSPVVQNEAERPAKWATLVDKQLNLYQIDARLFRSQQLQSKDLTLLQRLGIKTVINLRFFDRNDDIQAFKQSSLNLINTPLLTWAISPKEVAAILWEIEQAQQQGAVLIHCYHGSDRTGLIAAMYRVIYQNWSLDEAKQEMIAGNFGFHPIWQNIENFFTEQKIAQIKQHLLVLKQQASGHF